MVWGVSGVCVLGGGGVSGVGWEGCRGLGVNMIITV